MKIFIFFLLKFWKICIFFEISKRTWDNFKSSSTSNTFTLMRVDELCIWFLCIVLEYWKYFLLQSSIENVKKKETFELENLSKLKLLFVNYPITMVWSNNSFKIQKFLNIIVNLFGKKRCLWILRKWIIWTFCLFVWR